jgi:short-subunit dehydrogenase
MAVVAGFSVLPHGGLAQRVILATMGAMSAGAFGYHQSRRKHPACPSLPPGEEELALVTGASSGIGREISLELAKKGFGLVLVARRADKLNELAEEIHMTRQSTLQNKIPIHVVSADLTKPDAAQHLFNTVVREKGLRVTALINNAGLGHTELFIHMPISKMEEIIHLNTLALTTLTRLFGAEMAKRGRGRIMSVSSIAGAAPGPLVAVYSATKAFVSSFTSAIQHELEPLGVSITNLVPGATFTEFQARAEAHTAMAFSVPGLAMSADRVARAGVKGMLRGDSIVIPGVVNQGFVLATAIFPAKLMRVVTQMAWSEMPI